MVRPEAGRYAGAVVATFGGKPLPPLADRIRNLAQGLWILALLALIALKFTGGIAWSWWWVLAPLWIGCSVLTFRSSRPGAGARIWNLGQRAALPALIALKLTGVIAWSWWWVLTPLWIIGIIVIAFLLLLVAGTWPDRRRRWQHR
jgi:hypothetical protein